MANDKVNVAIIGLGFGAEFIPIYQKHPRAHMYAICRRDQAELNRIGDACGIEKRFTKYEDVLGDPLIDFVHINSPIPDHGWMSVAALKASASWSCSSATWRAAATGLEAEMAATTAAAKAVQSRLRFSGFKSPP